MSVITVIALSTVAATMALVSLLTFFDVWLLTKVKRREWPLEEMSLVSIPANQDAVVESQADAYNRGEFPSVLAMYRHHGFDALADALDDDDESSASCDLPVQMVDANGKCLRCHGKGEYGGCYHCGRFENGSWSDPKGI